MGLNCMKYILRIDTEEEAARAYDKYALHLHGKKCESITSGKTNFDYTRDELLGLLNDVDLSDAT